MGKTECNKTDRAYWEDNFINIHPHVVKGVSAEYKTYYDRYLTGLKGSCLELGAYPGHNLIGISKAYGLKPCSFDFLNKEFMEQAFKLNGIDEYEIICEDINNHRFAKQYDCVISHGFVEHFENYSEICKKHFEAVKSGGVVFITVPVLQFFQMWIRKILYKPEILKKILASHNKKIMNHGALKKEIKRYQGEWDILFAGYIRGMTIWFGEETVRAKRLWFFRLLKKVEKRVNRLGFSSFLFSPQYLLVARRRDKKQ